MPTLTVNLAYDAPDSGVELDDDLDITVQALDDVVREAGGVTYVINPWPLKLSLTAGQGAITLAAGYYWVHHPWGSKLVSLQADARLDQLPAIDPATLDPDEPMSPAWQAMLDALSDRVTDLEEGGVGEPGADGASAYEVAVAQGFVGDEAAWLLSLKGADGEDGEDGAPGAPGAPGEDGEDGIDALNVYASRAEVDGLTSTQLGTLNTDWADWASGIVFSYTGVGIVETVAHVAGANTVITQRAFIGSHSSTPSGTYLSRRKIGAAAWSAWTAYTYVASPPVTATGGEAVNMATLHFINQSLGLVLMASTAELDAYGGDTARGAVEYIADLGAYLGLSEFSGKPFAFIPYEHYLHGQWPNQARVQRLYVADAAGALRVVERKKSWVSPAAEPAWSAWAPVSSGGAIKTYADAAALDAETGVAMGTFTSANWGTYTGVAFLNNISGTALVSTESTMTASGTSYLSQSALIEWFTNRIRIRRVKNTTTGVWGAWYDEAPGTATARRLARYGSSNELFVRTTPTSNFEATSKFYVDQRAIDRPADGAYLDTLTDEQQAYGKVLVDNITTYTGIPGYSFAGGVLWFESCPLWLSTGAGVWYQRLSFPDITTGAKLTAERRRTFPPGGPWSAWSAWAIV